jgi:hypothetical protein
MYAQLEEKREIVRATYDRKKFLWGLLGAVSGMVLCSFLIISLDIYAKKIFFWLFILTAALFGILYLIYLLTESATATDTEIIIRKAFACYRVRWDEIEDYGLEPSTLHPMLVLKSGKCIRLNKKWGNLASLQNAISQRAPYVKAAGIWLPFGVRPHEWPHTFAYGEMPIEVKRARWLLAITSLALLITLITSGGSTSSSIGSYIAPMMNFARAYKGYRKTRHLPERFQVDSEGIIVSGVSNGRLYPWREIASTKRDRDWIKVFNAEWQLLFEFSVYLPNANALLAAIQYKIDVPHTPINIIETQMAEQKK